jgi:hypothetical protein
MIFIIANYDVAHLFYKLHAFLEYLEIPWVWPGLFLSSVAFPPSSVALLFSSFTKAG